MRAQLIQTRQSTGRVLCRTILSADGKKLLGKGHMISHEDTYMLESEEMYEVWVTKLEEGEISENEAFMKIAREIGCGSDPTDMISLIYLARRWAYQPSRSKALGLLLAAVKM